MSQNNVVKLKASYRLFISAVIGIMTVFLVMKTDAVTVAPLAGWVAAGLFFVISILVSVLKSDASSTKAHAVTEDPGRAPTDTIVVLASIASIVGVIVLIFQATNVEGALKFMYVAVALASVIVSWLVVHTTFMLNYAREYYSTPEGGIDFNSEGKPRYSDFAYLSFTVGMTFQVSDTVITSPKIRMLILRQALLSYLFGTLIIASTVNFLAGLGS